MISDLRTLIKIVNEFMGDICEFYDYRESRHLAKTGYDEAVSWIRKLGFFIENSLGNVKDDINAIAHCCEHPDYMNLNPEEASTEILKKVIPSDEFLSLRMSMALELRQRIAELRDELLRKYWE